MLVVVYTLQMSFVPCLPPVSFQLEGTATAGSITTSTFEVRPHQLCLILGRCRALPFCLVPFFILCFSDDCGLCCRIASRFTVSHLCSKTKPCARSLSDPYHRLDLHDRQKRRLALESGSFNLKSQTFVDNFPEVSKRSQRFLYLSGLALLWTELR
jgi:hypothetical protein